MTINLGRMIRWGSIFPVILACLVLVACGGQEKGSTVPEGCDGATWGSSVVVEERDGDFVAIVEGDYPDSCSTTCGSEQEVE